MNPIGSTVASLVLRAGLQNSNTAILWAERAQAFPAETARRQQDVARSLK